MSLVIKIVTQNGRMNMLYVSPRDIFKCSKWIYIYTCKCMNKIFIALFQCSLFNISRINLFTFLLLHFRHDPKHRRISITIIYANVSKYKITSAVYNNFISILYLLSNKRKTCRDFYSTSQWSNTSYVGFQKCNHLVFFKNKQTLIYILQNK